jgi:hypothetical protein
MGLMQLLERRHGHGRGRAAASDDDAAERGASDGVIAWIAFCTSVSTRRTSIGAPSWYACRAKWAQSRGRGSGSAVTISLVMPPIPPMTSPAASKAAAAMVIGFPCGRPRMTKQTAS